MVGHAWQAGEHVAQIFPGIELPAATGFDDRKENGAGFSDVSVTDEQPVLLAYGGWADGVLHGVVVDERAAIFQIHLKVTPQCEGVGDGFAHEALRQDRMLLFPSSQQCADALDDHVALLLPDYLPQLGAGRCITQVLFDLIQPLDEQEHGGGLSWRGFLGFVELAPDVCPARGEAEASVALCGMGLIRLITVAAEDAGEVGGDDVAQTTCAAAGAPHEQGVAFRKMEENGVSVQKLTE